MNHSLHFADPSNPSINTNRIEPIWRHAKEFFSTHGRVKAHVPGNLAKFMFSKAVRSKNCDPTEEFLKMVAYVYSTILNEENDTEENDTEECEILE